MTIQSQVEKRKAGYLQKERERAAAALKSAAASEEKRAKRSKLLASAPEKIMFLRSLPDTNVATLMDNSSVTISLAQAVWASLGETEALKGNRADVLRALATKTAQCGLPCPPPAPATATTAAPAATKPQEIAAAVSTAATPTPPPPH